MNLTFSTGNTKNLLNQRQIKTIEKATLLACSVIKKLPSDISITCATECEIRKLKKRFFNVDRTTDVIAFNYSHFPFHSAEIIICPETALKRHKEFKNSFMKELILYIVHGLLHIAGENDKTEKEVQKMRRKEEKIMKILCNKFPELKE